MKPRRWSSSLELQEVHLPPRLAVDEARRPARLRDPLDLDAPPAADGDVHVLARGAEAGADVPRRAADAADEEDRLLDLVGRAQVGPGDGLDERHPEAVGPPDDAVPAVAHLAAGVLLDRHLRDGERPAAERDLPVHADDGGPLEAGRDRAVEVLLPRDVDLVDDVAAEHEALLDGDVDRLLVHEERGRVVHLVGADVLHVEEVDDVLLRLELHQRGAVVLAELREGRPHVPEDRPVVGLGVEPRRAAAEELRRGQELLVDLQSADEAHLSVIEGWEHRPPFPLAGGRPAANGAS